MTCPDCRDTGIISRPYIAGVVSTMTACACDAGRQFAADIAAQRSAQPVIGYRAGAHSFPAERPHSGTWARTPTQEAEM